MMADSLAFVTVCERLEAGTALDRLEARGTVRLALRQAGLEARSVTAEQLRVVVEKILPAELHSRGVDASVCSELRAALNGVSDDSAATSDSPEAVFNRIAE